MSEKVLILAAAKSICRICSSYKHFSPSSCFDHRTDAKLSLLFRDGTLLYSPLLSVHNSTFSFEQDVLPFGKIIGLSPYL